MWRKRNHWNFCFFFLLFTHMLRSVCALVGAIAAIITFSILLYFFNYSLPPSPRSCIRHVHVQEGLDGARMAPTLAASLLEGSAVSWLLFFLPSDGTGLLPRRLAREDRDEPKVSRFCGLLGNSCMGFRVEIWSRSEIFEAACSFPRSKNYIFKLA